MLHYLSNAFVVDLQEVQSQLHCGLSLTGLSFFEE